MRRLSLLLLLGMLAAVSASAQQQLNGPVMIQLDSKVLSEKRLVLVRTPASYSQGARSYPVLYMTDGDRHIGHTAAVIDYLVREGRMPEVIIVGISNTDRTRDLTPTKVDSMDGGRFPMPTSGGADRFLEFITTELIPHVEKTYRTQPYRVFAGHSFGGLFAMHTFFTRPEVFNAVIAVSPTLTWDDRYVWKRAVDWVKSGEKRPATLVFSVGNEGEELDREFDSLQKLLKKNAPKDLEWEAIRLGDEDHGSVVLPTHYAALRKVFEPLRFRLDPRDPDPKTLYARARDHFARASRRFGFPVQVPEATANVIGYRLLQAGHVREAIEVFEANAKTWPDSANVYDSLGEAQERAGQVELAAWNYRKAAELGKRNNDPNTAIFEQNAKRVAGK